MSQEVSQESSCIRILLRKVLPCFARVFAELTLSLEYLHFFPCDVPVDEVDEVDIRPADGLVTPVVMNQSAIVKENSACLSAALQVVRDWVDVHNMT